VRVRQNENAQRVLHLLNRCHTAAKLSNKLLRAARSSRVL
jgi:hypothetical protein